MPRGKVAVELKLDGTSIEILYEKGRFSQAITRGDGNEGEDVTHTIRNAHHLPKTISLKDRQVSVRCECLLYIKTWQGFFSDMANPRNAAAGLTRRSSAEGSEHLALYAFDVLFDDNAFPVLPGFTTEQDKIDWLTQEKFVTTPCEVIDISKAEEAIKRIEDQRDTLPMEIDGAVIKMNDIAEQKRLGEHKGRPYWARAWKFAAMGGHSVLEGVTWSVGTRGTITPVANIAPVLVAGATIRNVSLSNADEIERLGICIGDKVEVIRAGDVIPKIIKVIAKGSQRLPITLNACPVCGADVIRDGPFYRCSNAGLCSGVNDKRIKKYIKKRNIMFLGDSNTDKLIDNGYLRTIPDIYNLTVSGMVEAGLGKRMSEKIKAEIDKSKTCSLSDMIGSLSLDMLGRSEAANLVGYGVDTLDKWFGLNAKEIESYPGYQATKANRIAVALRDNWGMIASVAKHLVIESPLITKESSGMLTESFCFTGKMENKRAVLEQMATDAGGRVASVSKGLDYLVIADPGSTSTKAVKARKLGTKLISEEEFLEMVGD